MGFSLDDDEQESPLAGAADVASAAAAIADNAPPVSPMADSMGEKTNETGDSNSSAGASNDDERDSAGETWSAEKHSATKKKNKDGTWKARRGVGKLGTSTKTAKAEAKQTQESAAQLAAKAKMAGQVAAFSQFMVCSGLFGPEWKPLLQKIDVPDGMGGTVTVEVNEMAEQSELWGNWFLATGRTDFPPGIALTLGMFSYAARRFTMPETQRRAGKLKEWAAAKFAAWKVRRADKKAAKNASADTRQNTERKDNASDGASRSVQAAR